MFSIPVLYEENMTLHFTRNDSNIYHVPVCNIETCNHLALGSIQVMLTIYSKGNNKSKELKFNFSLIETFLGKIFLIFINRVYKCVRRILRAKKLVFSLFFF